jgi:hypothetical protein
MWKTPGGFWAQMDPFAYILPPEIAQIHWGANGLALFRRPFLKKRDDALGLAGGHHHERNQDSCRSDSLELRRTNPFGIGLFSMGLHINSQVFCFY